MQQSQKKEKEKSIDCLATRNDHAIKRQLASDMQQLPKEEEEQMH